MDPEDVVLLAVAYDLKSPRMGEWSRKGWLEGWKALGCVVRLCCVSQTREGSRSPREQGGYDTRDAGIPDTTAREARLGQRVLSAGV